MTDLHAQIDDYLAGKLSAEAREQFEQEMKNNPSLASELALFREMAAALAPSGEDNLRANLEQLGRKYTPSEPTLRRRWWIPGSLLLLLFVGWGIWKWLSAAAPPPPAPPQSAPPADSVAERNAPQATAPPKASDTAFEPAQRLVAARFEPNPRLESLLGTQFRGDACRFRLDEPRANGQLVKKAGSAVFRLSGTIETNAETAALPPFRVLLFSNRPSDYEQFQPLFLQDLPVEKTGASPRFRLDKALKLPPGLYYFLIEDPDTGMLYHVGKVTLAK